MNPNRPAFVLLLLGAWAATLAQVDARPRGGKHPADVAGHVGAHRPAGTAKRPPNAAPTAPARNAIGIVTQPTGVGAAKQVTGAPPAAAVKPNAINTHLGTVVVAPSMPSGAGRIGSTTNPANAVRAVPSAVPLHAGGINGTGIAHPSSTLGTIGGPAKIAGGISGTGMKKKR
jgi:mRNA-degrading endonuclease toxin of MazEF toxin-antitoxin module